MSQGNLTRDEAQHRAAILRVHSYSVELDLTGGSERFESRSTVRFDCADPGTSTFLDLIATEVTAVTQNGRDLDPTRVYRDGRVHLDDVASENTVTVVARLLAAFARRDNRTAEALAHYWPVLREWPEQLWLRQLVGGES